LQPGLGDLAHHGQTCDLHQIRLCWENLSRQLDRKKETAIHVAEQAFACSTGTPVGFFDRYHVF
jgi:hypothetical protein